MTEARDTAPFIDAPRAFAGATPEDRADKGSRKRRRGARLWTWFWSPTARYSWGAIFAIGGLTGMVLLAGFTVAMEQTKTLGFCISCHELRQTVYEEYKKSAHYMNASGVRVICSDCHVPKQPLARLVRQVKAASEVYHKLIGTIDTVEKFEARRLLLATRVWDTMKANDSRECRNCHSYDAMAFHQQSRRGSAKMQEAMTDGKTCIDCHKGLTHKLPKGYRKDD